MGFIYDDYTVFAQQCIMQGLSKQYTICHKLDPCIIRSSVTETDFITNYAAEWTHFFGDTT